MSIFHDFPGQFNQVVIEPVRFSYTFTEYGIKGLGECLRSASRTGQSQAARRVLVYMDQK